MKLIVNGEDKEHNAPLSVSELLKRENVQMPETVSVQLNEEFVAQEHYASTQLKEGDVINFLYFMGGGSFCGFF
ncbi:MAG: sulfur carrier protein ThiS [Helicobacter sp.]|nr:sulfur carrier protein ThiS [Helicobacter sp.]